MSFKLLVHPTRIKIKLIFIRISILFFKPSDVYLWSTLWRANKKYMRWFSMASEYIFMAFHFPYPLCIWKKMEWVKVSYIVFFNISGLYKYLKFDIYIIQTLNSTHKNCGVNRFVRFQTRLKINLKFGWFWWMRYQYHLGGVEHGESCAASTSLFFMHLI